MGLIGDLFTPSKKDGKTVININNEQLNSFVSTTMSAEKSNMSTTIAAVQSMNLTKLKFKNCTPVISQSSDIKATSIQKIESASADKMATDVAGKMKAALEAETKKENGFLSTGGGPKGDVITSVSNKMETAVRQEMSSTKLNEILTAINAAQSMDITDLDVDMCPINTDILEFLTGPEKLKYITDSNATCKDNSGKWPSCPIDQAQTIAVLTEQTVKNISKNESMVKALSELDQYSNVSSISKNQGIGDSIGDAARGVGTGVGTAAKGVGEGVGSVFSGMGTGIWIFIFMIILAAAAFYYFKMKE